MNLDFIKKFDLRKDKDSRLSIRNTIEKETVFEGTNLWILFFAILIASLGLNTNSTAVIIGAMLISPLMGPIVGIGFAVATNDLKLLRSGISNYLFALIIGLLASTIYFLLSPIEDAHSEILARTQPTIFDVLIALFGGFAGFVAVNSKTKGNVIPGVAIATALMPPLCTAGYGLATWQLDYFFGAFYLYWINSVFIAFATIVSAFLLKFPTKKYEDQRIERREKGILYTIVLLTLIPSLYFGYKIVQDRNFTTNANNFITEEAFFENDYLLKKEIDPNSKTIHLTYGGKVITEDEIQKLKGKLKYFNLENVELIIHQGFSLTDKKSLDNLEMKLQNVLAIRENENLKLNEKLDSLNSYREMESDVSSELMALNNSFDTVIVESNVWKNKNSTMKSLDWLVVIETKKKPAPNDQNSIKNWLVIRLKSERVKLIYSD
jgi:uncharacterized hydrophobic protein (TIGR00271 family)